MCQRFWGGWVVGLTTQSREFPLHVGDLAIGPRNVRAGFRALVEPWLGRGLGVPLQASCAVGIEQAGEELLRVVIDPQAGVAFDPPQISSAAGTSR